MNIDNQDNISAIIEYCNNTDLKGRVEIRGDSIWWYLGDVILEFYIDSREATVLYYCKKKKPHYIGHFHEDHSAIIPLIQDINSEDKIVCISVIFGESDVKLINKDTPKKKSRFFVRRYYSI